MMLAQPAQSAVDPVFEIDASGSQHAVGVPLADGRVLQMGETAHRIWSAMQAGLPAQTVAEGLPAYTAAQIEAAYARLQQQVATLASGRPPRRAQWLTRPLLPARWVALFTQPLRFLFASPACAIAALSLCLLFMLQTSAQASATASRLLDQPVALFITALLVLLSSLFHELGHATALAKAGQKPGPIGIAMYFFLPVFYSDVARAWRLSREQRMQVDLGGPYFSLLAAALLGGAHWLTGDANVQRAAWLTLASALASLSPLMRHDGYWFLVDALGITQLNTLTPGKLWTAMRTMHSAENPRWLWFGLLGYCGVLSVFVVKALLELSRIFRV